MNPDLSTQLPANVDNAPAALGAARYPQANNCVDKSYAASNTKFMTRPNEPLLLSSFDLTLFFG